MIAQKFGYDLLVIFNVLIRLLDYLMKFEGGFFVIICNKFFYIKKSVNFYHFDDNFDII